MKANLYSPFSTLWKTFFHGMENIRTGLRPRDPLPRFMSVKPPTGFMKMRAEQRGAGYGPQTAAMHTLPHAAHLSSTARGPIQTPDVRLKDDPMNRGNL